MLAFAKKHCYILACTLQFVHCSGKKKTADRSQKGFQSMSISQKFSACLSKYPCQSLIIHRSFLQNFGPLLLIRRKRYYFRLSWWIAHD